ncbi:MAG TPA: DUF3090 family protein [Chloroflexota bacterium]|nr:DUF3090 family protein [Chloroflexota bacterium]
MSQTRHEFGPVMRLEADALGEPGQRTFCLLAAAREGSAALWLEKEELQALGVAIDQLLARLSDRPEWKLYGAPAAEYQPSQGFSPEPLVEFKVGQLSLGYESDSDLFALLVHDAEDDPEGPATFSCLASAAQMRALSRRIETVISAGRPRCPLCGDAIEPEGHNCVRAN